MRSKFIPILVALTFFGHGLGQAEEKIQVSLYLAENAPPTAAVILAPEKMTGRLHEVFGYKHYQLLKEEALNLGDHWIQWVVPRKDFFIGIEPEGGDSSMISYQIYKDGFIVAQGRYELQDETPLFIRGPNYHHGHLIFVVQGRHE